MFYGSLFSTDWMRINRYEGLRAKSGYTLKQVSNETPGAQINFNLRMDD